MVEIQCNLGSGQYGVVATDKSAELVQTICEYASNLSPVRKDFDNILQNIESFWGSYREKIYEEINDEIVLCFNGFIIIDGEKEYFEYR